MRVLVLEVGESEIQSLKALLKMGHKVFICKSGGDCLIVLEKKEFDLLMVDVEIASLGGLEAVIALRNREKGTGKHLPVVALGALPGSGRIPGMEVGFDHELRKPIQIPQLLALMDKLDPKPAAPSVDKPPKIQEPRPPGSSLDAPSAINEKAALALCDGDIEFFHEILQVFVADAVTHIEKLKIALSNKDADFTQRHAHALKGASGNVCAEQFKSFAAQIERAAKNKDLSQTDGLFEGLCQEYFKIKAFAQKVIPGLSADG